MAINLRNPTTQKWIIAGTMMFGAMYAYVNFVYTPREDKIARLAVDVEKESELLAKGKRIAANFRTVQDDYARLMQSWDIAQGLLPTEREMEGLLKSITVAGQRNDITFMLFRPQDPVEQAYYWENPIQIRTRSNMHDLGRFMSDVAALDRIVNMSNMKLTAFRPPKGKSPSSVDAEFTATIYVFKPLGAPTTVTPTEDENKKGAKRKPQPRATGASATKQLGDEDPATKRGGA